MQTIKNTPSQFQNKTSLKMPPTLTHKFKAHEKREKLFIKAFSYYRFAICFL